MPSYPKQGCEKNPTQMKQPKRYLTTRAFIHAECSPLLTTRAFIHSECLRLLIASLILIQHCSKSVNNSHPTTNLHQIPYLSDRILTHSLTHSLTTHSLSFFSLNTSSVLRMTTAYSSQEDIARRTKETRSLASLRSM